jgi:phage host-nuclease inhibitor protein Gam
MESVHRTYSLDEEMERLYTGMGVEGSKSNGHREGLEESMNLVESIKSLQKDVQSYKANIDRLMKAKEEQEDFNIKLL